MNKTSEVDLIEDLTRKARSVISQSGTAEMSSGLSICIERVAPPVDEPLGDVGSWDSHSQDNWTTWVTWVTWVTWITR